MEIICKINTAARTIKGITRAIYNDDPLWYEGCENEEERIGYTRRWLGNGLEWEEGKSVTILCL